MLQFTVAVEGEENQVIELSLAGLTLEPETPVEEEQTQPE